MFPLPDSFFDVFTRASFSEIPDLCTRYNLFIFNNQLYMQLDGALLLKSIYFCVTMNNNCLINNNWIVQPILNNHCFLNNNWINNCSPEFNPTFYRQHVKDTFVLFKNPSQIQTFLQYFNNRHSRMKFTLEATLKNSIAVLDINIVKRNDSFATNLYRKPKLEI